MKTSDNLAPLVFGIYPGGGAGSDEGEITGPPDDPAQIEAALRLLQGQVQPFIIRAYERHSDAEAPSPWSARTPDRYEQYLHAGRQLDLVVMFQSARGDVAGYLEFVRALIRQHGQHLYSIQITEEANFTDGPTAIDGPWPNVREALVQGVIAAKEELRILGGNARVGFNSTPTFGPAAEFWTSIGALGGQPFLNALDYVGLDFFPDVFRRVAPDGEPGDLATATLAVLETLRNVWLPAAGIPPTLPIHITEHGWATDPTRPPARQNEVVEQVIRIVHEARQRLHIARYSLFGLRDTDSSKPNFFYQFGLLRDDYTPKPAFQTYARLIAELSGAA
ncbi:MAG: hypothetical protein HYR56_34715 [Acidobacteria bacterium]|nr:hypothetical protein [Acidobacteriota bacterium]MBI3422848.1 hypothetical protein [Acidobacteriota bacterium]